MISAIAMSVLLVVAFGVFTALMLPRTKLLLRAKPEARFDRIGDRVAAVLKFAFGQARLMREPVVMISSMTSSDSSAAPPSCATAGSVKARQNDAANVQKGRNTLRFNMAVSPDGGWPHWRTRWPGGTVECADRGKCRSHSRAR